MQYVVEYMLFHPCTVSVQHISVPMEYDEAVAYALKLREWYNGDTSITAANIYIYENSPRHLMVPNSKWDPVAKTLEDAINEMSADESLKTKYYVSYKKITQMYDAETSDSGCLVLEEFPNYDSAREKYDKLVLHRSSYAHSVCNVGFITKDIKLLVKPIGKNELIQREPCLTKYEVHFYVDPQCTAYEITLFSEVDVAQFVRNLLNAKCPDVYSHPPRKLNVDIYEIQYNGNPTNPSDCHVFSRKKIDISEITTKESA